MHRFWDDPNEVLLSWNICVQDSNSISMSFAKQIRSDRLFGQRGCTKDRYAVSCVFGASFLGLLHRPQYAVAHSNRLAGMT